MKLSIVILCWNDLTVITDCLRSIYSGTKHTEFEVIVSDNGSTDGSIEFIRSAFPEVRVIENGKNLGFARGNNVGINVSCGDYILILNPDTIIHDGSLDRWIDFADKHQEAGAFGCRVLNPDGSFQDCARPFPTIFRYWIAALYLRPLAYLSKIFLADTYTGWTGTTSREIDWQSGCCVMFRGELLKRLGGFDEQFFYTKEEVDLCLRVWKAGYPIVYTPEATITHLGGQSVNRFPVKFAIEEYRSGYRYFYKHYGMKGARQYRRVSLIRIRVRQFGYGLMRLLKPTAVLQSRMDMYCICARWNKQLDPMGFLKNGTEPPPDILVTQ